MRGQWIPHVSPCSISHKSFHQPALPFQPQGSPDLIHLPSQPWPPLPLLMHHFPFFSMTPPTTPHPLTHTYRYFTIGILYTCHRFSEYTGEMCGCQLSSQLSCRIKSNAKYEEEILSSASHWKAQINEWLRGPLPLGINSLQTSNQAEQEIAQQTGKCVRSR